MSTLGREPKPPLAEALAEVFDAIRRELVAEIRAELTAGQDKHHGHWLDTEQAANYLGVHPVTLRKLAANGRVPFEQDKPGAKLWFEASRLDSWRRGQGHEAA